MKNKTVVFDLDGTFIDTAPDIIDSLNHCLQHAGMAPADEHDIANYVGHGGRVMIARAFEVQKRELAESLHDKLLELFLEHYRANIPGRSVPFEGAVDALSQLRNAGFRTAICTNKFESLSVALIDALGLRINFDAICGSDTYPFRKPDPRHLTKTIEAAGGATACALMVGDSQTDINTAKAAGIPVVAVDFGYSAEHVSAFAPTHIISRYDELTPDLADRLIGGK